MENTQCKLKLKELCMAKIMWNTMSYLVVSQLLLHINQKLPRVSNKKTKWSHNKKISLGVLKKDLLTIIDIWLDCIPYKMMQR